MGLDQLDDFGRQLDLRAFQRADLGVKGPDHVRQGDMRHEALQFGGLVGDLLVGRQALGQAAQTRIGRRLDRVDLGRGRRDQSRVAASFLAPRVVSVIPCAAPSNQRLPISMPAIHQPLNKQGSQRPIQTKPAGAVAPCVARNKERDWFPPEEEEKRYIGTNKLLAGRIEIRKTGSPPSRERRSGGLDQGARSVREVRAVGGFLFSPSAIPGETTRDIGRIVSI